MQGAHHLARAVLKRYFILQENYVTKLTGKMPRSLQLFFARFYRRLATGF
jgi:hypothetical protein